MNKYHILILSFLCSLSISAQSLYLISTDYELYSVNLDDCELSFITDVDFNQVYDISFHPNGVLYGIGRNGDLFEIDTLTGVVDVVHVFPHPDNALRYNSLTISADGIIYTTNERGELFSFELSTGEEVFYGIVGYEAAGDITFYEGVLYIGARSQRIIQVDLESPANSRILVDDLLRHNIFGLTSTNEDCIERTYVVSTESNLDNSDLFQFNWEMNTVDFLCDFDVGFFGSASRSEIYSSTPPMIIEDVVLNPSTCGIENGTVDIIVNGGNGALSYSLDGANFQMSSLFENLPAGDYTLAISDETGCLQTRDVQIESSGGLEFDSVIFDSTSCGSNNGSITAFPRGGVEPYEYSIDQLSYQPSNNFENLSPGSYIISARDVNGCMTMRDIEIEGSAELAIESIETTPSVCGEDIGEVMFQILGESDSIQLLINGVDYSAFTTIGELASGAYEVLLSDENNCQIDTSFIIGQNECSIYIPNVFSPNGDGENDFFSIYPPSSFTGLFTELSIYDRWGELVFEMGNFDSESLNWNGTFNGELLAAGVYVYCLKYEVSSERTEIIRGDITLLL